MDNERTFIATATSVDETKQLAKQLATCLRAGDVILLSGDLGAGKTQFTQGLAAGLGASEAVISPTFNIVLTYGSGRLPLHHFDLYRLEADEQLEDIALREYLESDGVCVIEWAEKFPTAYDEYLALDIEKTGDDERTINGFAGGKRGEELLENLRSLLGSSVSEKTEGNRPSSGNQTTIAGGRGESNSGPADDVCKEVLDGEGRATNASVDPDARFVLAFDTANEVVAVAIGQLDPQAKTVDTIVSREVQAHRASNTTLVPLIDEMIKGLGVKRSQIACVCVGRGPGSFTGVRIAMAAAKGIAQALGVGLIGVSTLDAIAWNALAAGVQGQLLVVADAMRKEVYPVFYSLDEKQASRLTSDRVVKAAAFVEELAQDAKPPAMTQTIGDGLVKYRELIEPCTNVLDEALWAVTGRGLLLALQDAWRTDEADPFDTVRHNPAYALPVYTRLSDAEENERIRLSKTDSKNLRTGVQDVAPDGGKGRATMHSEAVLAAPAGAQGVSYRPLDAQRAADVAQLEQLAMGTDAWSDKLVADELGQRNRTWWVAEADNELVGYAGGLVIDADLQILKVAVAPEWRRHGIARELIARIAEDARNLGAETCSLEVRESNENAQEFYRAIGLEDVGVRPRYYSDGEGALIMQGPLPVAVHDVAGMELQHHDETVADEAKGKHPLILAIESSCDETAAAIVDGEAKLLSDVVASQIDFHARFGGVVPEIASRKHIEAICGVCDEALDVATQTGGSRVRWSDLDAVAVTYAPGLLGALVVGVAYAKGVAWALDVPFIGVNHLEGHLYANKIGCEGFEPPAVVSLVSGGNTMLVHMRDWGDYVTLGATIDDAVGEAFDKVAKALGLGYPGGPAISKLAAEGNPDAIPFPRAMLHSHDLRFSLSGLKTAVVTYINNERAAGRELSLPDIAASFQQAVVDVQVAKAKAALIETDAPTFCLGGGVAANPVLRRAYEDMCAKQAVKLVMPPLSSCGDNAGMIALVALDRYNQRKFFDLSADALAHANLDELY